MYNSGCFPRGDAVGEWSWPWRKMRTSVLICIFVIRNTALCVHMVYICMYTHRTYTRLLKNMCAILVYFCFWLAVLLRPGYTAVQGHTGMLRVWFICAVLVCCFIRGLHQGRATLMPSFAVIAPQFPRAVRCMSTPHVFVCGCGNQFCTFWQPRLVMDLCPLRNSLLHVAYPGCNNENVPILHSYRESFSIR
jgi:hypothetical protein